MTNEKSVLVGRTRHVRPKKLHLQPKFDHSTAPLFENIIEFQRNLKAPFYCPGHKGGRTLAAELGNSIGAMDLNNLADTDTLHCPTGSIRQAEGLLANAYGVDRSFFMVGGSSLGNIAGVMSVAGPGQKVLVQRNAHKSIIAGIVHSGAEPIWLSPQWDARFGIAHGLPIATVDRALAAHPDAKALIALNPTYFGVVPNFRAIADRVGKTDLAMIADEAHGPHFHFGEGFPAAAEDCGANLVVQSTHKILSGLSQAATLHLIGDKVDPSRVQAALQSLQTTSPNFAILASIDLARRQMMLQGRELLASMLSLADRARSEIAEIDGIQVMGPQHAMGTQSGFFDLDRTKLLIDTSRLGWSGANALHFLNRQFGVQPELYGAGYVLCILTVGSNDQDVDFLVQAFQSLAKSPSPKFENFTELNELAERCATSLPETVVLPREAFYAKQRYASPKEAIGCVSGEVITPYPPGIPVIMPGERFSRDTVELLKRVKRSGCPISCVDPSLERVKILAGY